MDHMYETLQTLRKHGIYAVVLHRISVGRFTLVSGFSGTWKVFGPIADGHLVLFILYFAVLL